MTTNQFYRALGQSTPTDKVLSLRLFKTINGNQRNTLYPNEIHCSIIIILYLEIKVGCGRLPPGVKSADLRLSCNRFNALQGDVKGRSASDSDECDMSHFS